MPTEIRIQRADSLPFTEQWLRDIASVFRQTEQATIHKARNELKVLTINDLEVVVKSFKVPNPLNRLMYSYVRAGKAKKSFDNGEKLRSLGICTPRPLATVEYYQNGLLNDSYFVAERWRDDFTIREPILDKNFPDRAQLLSQLAQLAVSLQKKQVFHKDFSPGNILVRRENDAYRFCLVDINRMVFDRRGIVNPFVKLWLDDDDMATVAHEFIQSFAQPFNLNPTQWVAQAIADNRRYKTAKEQRRALKKRWLGK